MKQEETKLGGLKFPNLSRKDKTLNLRNGFLVITSMWFRNNAEVWPRKVFIRLKLERLQSHQEPFKEVKSKPHRYFS